jgi:hypothetical protein
MLIAGLFDLTDYNISRVLIKLWPSATQPRNAHADDISLPPEAVPEGGDRHHAINLINHHTRPPIIR